MSGTIQNRESFLNTIAGRLGRPINTSNVERPQWKHQPQHEVLKDATQDELVEVLKTQCTKIHTQFISTTAAKLSSQLKETIEQLGGQSIITWKDERFTSFGLTSLLKEELPSENVEVREWDYEQGSKNILFADKANIGITISDMTLAESGTVVLLSNKDRGRSVSFLPMKSIMLIPKSTLVPRMTQAAQMLREKAQNGDHIPSCINFITGPSNSADIEMNLVVGVHGPVQATYILIDDL